MRLVLVSDPGRPIWTWQCNSTPFQFAISGKRHSTYRPGGGLRSPERPIDDPEQRWARRGVSDDLKRDWGMCWNGRVIYVARCQEGDGVDPFCESTAPQ